MPMQPRTIALTVASLLLATGAAGQDFDLSVASIMRGPELVGSDPSSIRWTDDGEWIYFEWKQGGRPWHEEPESYRVPARGGAPEQVSDAHMDSIGPLLARGELSRDRRWKVVSHDGDIWLIDRRSGELRRLTATEDVEGDPVLAPDARAIYFTRADDLFAIDRGTGAIRQLTEVRKGPPEDEDEEAEGLAAYLEGQQLELFEHLRREAEEREREEAERDAREAGERQPVHIEEDERVLGLLVAYPARAGNNPFGTVAHRLASLAAAVQPHDRGAEGHVCPRRPRHRLEALRCVGGSGAAMRSVSWPCWWASSSSAPVSRCGVTTAASRRAARAESL